MSYRALKTLLKLKLTIEENKDKEIILKINKRCINYKTKKCGSWCPYFIIKVIDDTDYRKTPLVEKEGVQIILKCKNSKTIYYPKNIIISKKLLKWMEENEIETNKIKNKKR